MRYTWVYMNTAKYKQSLEEEVTRLKEGLSLIGHETKELKDDWTANATGEQEADPNLRADQAEEIETNDSIIDTLEERLQEVHEALARIESGAFGKCMICGAKIEDRRLEANPAATTCLNCETD